MEGMDLASMSGPIASFYTWKYGDPERETFSRPFWKSKLVFSYHKSSPRSSFLSQSEAKSNNKQFVVYLPRSTKPSAAQSVITTLMK